MSRSMSNLAVRIVSPSINACLTHNAIDINAMPLYKGQPHHGFLLDSLKALELCTNLTDFRLAVNIMPSFLNIIQSKIRLRTLSFNGSLSEFQVEKITPLSGKLETLHVAHGSWSLMNVFPSWMGRLGPTLTQLSITVCVLRHLTAYNTE